MPAAEAKVVEPRPSSADSAAGAERLVPYVNMAAQWAEERSELLPVIEKVLAEGHWVGGPVIEII